MKPIRQNRRSAFRDPPWRDEKPDTTTDQHYSCHPCAGRGPVLVGTSGYSHEYFFPVFHHPLQGSPSFTSHHGTSKARLDHTCLDSRLRGNDNGRDSRRSKPSRFRHVESQDFRPARTIERREFRAVRNPFLTADDTFSGRKGFLPT